MTTLSIPDDVLRAAGLSKEEALTEFACQDSQNLSRTEASSRSPTSRAGRTARGISSCSSGRSLSRFGFVMPDASFNSMSLWRRTYRLGLAVAGESPVREELDADAGAGVAAHDPTAKRPAATSAATRPAHPMATAPALR